MERRNYWVLLKITFQDWLRKECKSWGGKFEGPRVDISAYGDPIGMVRSLLAMSREDYLNAPSGNMEFPSAQSQCQFCFFNHEYDAAVLSCGHVICQICRWDRVTIPGHVSCPLCPSHPNCRVSLNGDMDNVTGFRILSLDGGGVKGLALLRILERIKSRFTDVPLTSMFDIIAGTSIGGIIALGIRTGKDLKGLAETIKTVAKSVLDSRWAITKYWNLAVGVEMCDTAAFQQILTREFGDMPDLRLNTDYPRVFVTAQEVQNESMWILGNFPKKLRYVADQDAAGSTVLDCNRDGGPTHVLAQATASAYPYFEPTSLHNSRFIDGGFNINCNNPVKVAMEVANLERLEFNEDMSVDSVLSFGCGKAPKDWQPDIDIFAVVSKLTNSFFDGDRTFEGAEKIMKTRRKAENVVRINPPSTVGVCNPFSSSDIATIESETDKFLDSEMGHELVVKASNIIYAGFFRFHFDFSAASALESQYVTMSLRDLRIRGPTPNHAASVMASLMATFLGRFEVSINRVSQGREVGPYLLTPVCDNEPRSRQIIFRAEIPPGALSWGPNESGSISVKWKWISNVGASAQEFQAHISGSPRRFIFH
jgi:hypothetical protein